MDDFLKRRGFVRKEDMAQYVRQQARAMVRNSDLQTRYPELKDRASDLFQKTAAVYQQMLNDGYPEDGLTEIAAERAELQLIREGKRQTNGAAAPDLEEDDRLRSIQTQSGRRSTRASNGKATVSLTKAELAICEEMDVDPKVALAQKKEQMRTRRTLI